MRLVRFHMRTIFLFLASLAVLAACAGEGEGPAGPTPPVVTALPSPTFLPDTAAPTDTLTPSATPVLPTDTPVPTPTAVPTPAPALPEQFPDPANYAWVPFASGFASPVGLEHAGDGSGRLFVLEQRGLIRIIREGEVLAEPFLDISAQVSCCGERGLLGLAFHPDYEQNGFFYVNYTDPVGDTSISRFSVSEDPDRADPDSEVQLLHVAQPFPNHNGGATVFGPDGYLYLGLGDGGSGGDPMDNAQNPGVLLGKILRIDVNGGDPYAIPPDNPFAGGGGAPEVWAIGLRNPWRFTFDRQTGDLYIGDVGQNMWEEINFLPSGAPGGANFGWNYREGAHPYREGVNPPEGQELVDPAAEYEHAGQCSITGGFVYRGERLPEWQGIYLYGDVCSGQIWGLLRDASGAWQSQVLFETGGSITSFGEDENGEIYFANGPYGGDGTIFRLEEQ